MTKHIELTDVLNETVPKWLADALADGEPVTIQPPKPKHWQPQGGEFHASIILGAGRSVPSEEAIRSGAFSPTLEQAQAKADHLRIVARLISYRDEFAPGYVVPDTPGPTWFVYTRSGGKWDYSSDRVIRISGVVYMPKHVARELAAKLNSGEVVL